MSEGLQMCPAISKDGKQMTADEIAIHVRSCITLLSFVLANYRFSDVLETGITFATTFELEYSFLFIEAETEDIGAISNAPAFSQEQVQQRANDTFELQNQFCDALKYSNVFKVKHVRFFTQLIWMMKIFATSRNSDTSLLLRAGQHFLTNPEAPVENFAFHAFYKVGAQ